MSQYQVVWFDATTREVTVYDRSTSLVAAPASLELGLACASEPGTADDIVWGAGFVRVTRWRGVSEEPGLFWAHVS